MLLLSVLHIWLVFVGLIMATPVDVPTRSSGEQCLYEPYQGAGGDDYMIHGEYIIHFSSNHTLDLLNSFVGYNVSSHANFRMHE